MQAFAFQPVRHELGIFRFQYIKACLHHDLSRHVEASDQIPHPQRVVMKCPATGKTKFIKFPPSRAGKDVKCQGYARGDV